MSSARSAVRAAAVFSGARTGSLPRTSPGAETVASRSRARCPLAAALCAPQTRPAGFVVTWMILAWVLQNTRGRTVYVTCP